VFRFSSLYYGKQGEVIILKIELNNLRYNGGKTNGHRKFGSKILLVAEP